jgi:hypothetical protein
MNFFLNMILIFLIAHTLFFAIFYKISYILLVNHLNFILFLYYDMFSC